eukprot:COSAG01_NODE_70299_length_259_cov_0.587500_1_plen_27_part_01
MPGSKDGGGRSTEAAHCLYFYMICLLY